MDQIAAQLIGFAADHPQWIAALIFVLAFLNSFPSSGSRLWGGCAGRSSECGASGGSGRCGDVGGALGDISLYLLGQKNADHLGRIWRSGSIRT